MAVQESIINGDVAGLQAALEAFQPETLFSDGGNAFFLVLHANPEVKTTDRLKIFDLLHQKGCDIEHTNSSGQPLLLACIHGGFPSLAWWLIRHQATLTVTDKQNRTALHYCATSSGSPNLMRDILTSLQGPNLQAFIDAQDLDGNTAAFLAAHSKNLDALYTLLHFGANPFIQNLEGSSVNSLADTSKDVLQSLLWHHLMSEEKKKKAVESKEELPEQDEVALRRRQVSTSSSSPAPAPVSSPVPAPASPASPAQVQAKVKAQQPPAEGNMGALIAICLFVFLSAVMNAYNKMQ
eukprot:TRINITY_DN5762_c0_g1_i1.p1 TRINITY_DN5762_c0_g1~~TRINITY_DN5762_c0_g1_i1.p1  ORF type:complete len:295 (+),score=92.63 TRINITY_DN5762_c0_g1_i1:56-940(+)